MIVNDATNVMLQITKFRARIYSSLTEKDPTLPTLTTPKSWLLTGAWVLEV